MAWMNSAPRGHEATAARGAMISASVDIGGDDRESSSIGADQRRRDVQAMLTASHRTGSTRTRPGRLRPRRWIRMNQPSAGAGKKLASPRWRQPLPTRWARRSAANAVITLPIMRIAPPDGGRPRVRRLRRVSARGAGYPPGGLANRRRPPMHRPLRADRHGPHCRAGRMLMLTPTSRALMLLLSRVLAGAAKTVRQPGRKV